MSYYHAYHRPAPRRARGQAVSAIFPPIVAAAPLSGFWDFVRGIADPYGQMRRDIEEAAEDAAASKPVLVPIPPALPPDQAAAAEQQAQPPTPFYQKPWVIGGVLLAVYLYTRRRR